MALEVIEKGKVKSWASMLGIDHVPARPIRDSIFSLTTEPRDVERTFDLGAGVTVIHCKYELNESSPGNMPRQANVLEVDFSPNLEGFPPLGAPYLLEAIQQMGTVVMGNLARNMRNVDQEGNIVLPILRYTGEELPYTDYVVLPAPNILLFRTHRAMAIRINSMLKDFVAQQVIGPCTTEVYGADECPELAAIIFKYARKSDVRVTEALTKKVYVIYAPIIPFDAEKDRDQIVETTQSLRSQFMFVLGKRTHGKEV